MRTNFVMRKIRRDKKGNIIEIFQSGKKGTGKILKTFVSWDNEKALEQHDTYISNWKKKNKHLIIVEEN